MPYRFGPFVASKTHVACMCDTNQRTGVDICEHVLMFTIPQAGIWRQRQLCVFGYATKADRFLPSMPALNEPEGVLTLSSACTECGPDALTSLSRGRLAQDQ
jgi:hypothetical protein